MIKVRDSEGMLHYFERRKFDNVSNEWGVLEDKLKSLPKKLDLIFLDMDGVVNNTLEFREGYGGIYLGHGTVSISNVMPINKLFQLCFDNDIHIVISSAWNIRGTNHVKEQLFKFVSHQLVEATVIGCIPYITDTGSGRLDEVIEFISYLKDMLFDIDKVVCIDDESYDMVNFVKTDNTSGFLNSHLWKVNHLLGLESSYIRKLIKY